MIDVISCEWCVVDFYNDSMNDVASQELVKRVTDLRLSELRPVHELTEADDITRLIPSDRLAADEVKDATLVTSELGTSQDIHKGDREWHESF